VVSVRVSSPPKNSVFRFILRNNPAPGEYNTIISNRLSTFLIRYDTTEEFNVDSKAECDQLNLANETNANASAHAAE